MKISILILAMALLIGASSASSGDYTIVDTGQDVYYGDTVEITSPLSGEAYYGQDAQYDGLQPSYSLSGDGLTVSDNNTGLTWQRSADTDEDEDIDVADKLTWSELQTYPDILNADSFGGYNDWRLPSIKELYSLMDFRGIDPSGYEDTDTSGLIPFIDNDYFDFAYGRYGCRRTNYRRSVWFQHSLCQHHRRRRPNPLRRQLRRRPDQGLWPDAFWFR